MISSFRPQLACGLSRLRWARKRWFCAAKSLSAAQFSQPCCNLIASSGGAPAQSPIFVLASVLPLAFSKKQTCSIPLNNNSRTRRRKLRKQPLHAIAAARTPDELPVHRLVEPRPREDEVQDRPRVF